MLTTRKVVYTTLGLIIPLYIAPSVMWEILIVIAWTVYLARYPLMRAIGRLWHSRRKASED